MKRIFNSNAADRKVDTGLLLTVLILVIFGLVMVYSTSSYSGTTKFEDPAYYFKKQLFATAVGLAVMYITIVIDYRYWKKVAIPAYILSLVLSTAVLFVGVALNGSKRWLALGPLSFQPSEYAKLAVIVFLAYVISKRDHIGKRFLFLIGCFSCTLPIIALVGSNNLSTAIIILGISIIVIFISYPGYIPFIWICLSGIALMSVFLSMEAYRLERIMIWKDPEQYEKGYQTIQGLYAIGSGGLFGKGLGNSLQKLGFVPEAQNDMVFSIVCEELGLFGAIIVIACFALMLWRFFVIGRNCRSLYGTLITGGVFAHIAIQIILNIAVVSNSIPNTGITLPFISYGGTSIVFLLAEMGLVLNISKKIRHTTVDRHKS